MKQGENVWVMHLPLFSDLVNHQFAIAENFCARYVMLSQSLQQVDQPSVFSKVIRLRVEVTVALIQLLVVVIVDDVRTRGGTGISPARPI